TYSRPPRLPTQSAPPSARPSQTACPSPVVPPVTTATLPFKSKSFTISAPHQFKSTPPMYKTGVARVILNVPPREKNLSCKPIYWPLHGGDHRLAGDAVHCL